MRFPKSLRLTKWGDFAKVRKDGQSVAGKFLVLGVVANPGRPRFRTGFITSKKVGNAVTRNQVRRRLRSVVREFGEFIQSGVDVVTIARYRAGSATYEQLRREWRWLARKAGIMPEKEEMKG